VSEPVDLPAELQVRSLDPPTPPGWVGEVLRHQAPKLLVERGDARVELTECNGLALLRTVVPSARRLADSELRLAVERSYRVIAELLRERAQAPLRFWNYVPGIRERSARGLTRYEIFNLGRFQAFTQWHGTHQFGERLAAASAVDHLGEDLEVQVLASNTPGSPIENPRQTPAHRYSDRYGPLPPCFARATLVVAPPGSSQRLAIVAGTASIVGEDSQHPADLAAQLGETLLNLAHLSATFAGEVPRALLAPGGAEVKRALARYCRLRVYVVRLEDAAPVIAGVRRAFPRVQDLELFRADLCRSELLVEIEGLACAPAEREGQYRGRA